MPREESKQPVDRRSERQVRGDLAHRPMTDAPSPGRRTPLAGGLETRPRHMLVHASFRNGAHFVSYIDIERAGGVR